MNERIESFAQALQRLQEALDAEKTSLNRDASIQRFEFCVELAWKSMQKFLESEKIICNSPKACLQEAFQIGLIQDDITWIHMLDDRNLTVHTYKEQLAIEIYGRLGGYVTLLRQLFEKFQSSLKE